MRVCKTCGISKPVTEFYPRTPGVCGECQRKKSKEYSSTPEYREWLKGHNKKRYLKHREKQIARALTNKAVYAGKIIKPTECTSCGETKPIQAHHDDYTKILEVRWLCNLCHKAVHGRLVDSKLKQGRPNG